MSLCVYLLRPFVIYVVIAFFISLVIVRSFVMSGSFVIYVCLSHVHSLFVYFVRSLFLYLCSLVLAFANSLFMSSVLSLVSSLCVSSVRSFVRDLHVLCFVSSFVLSFRMSFFV